MELFLNSSKRLAELFVFRPFKKFHGDQVSVLLLCSSCITVETAGRRSAPAEIMAVRSNDGNHNMCFAIALELCILVCSEAISAPARLSTS